jgi:hypothetical protein
VSGFDAIRAGFRRIVDEPALLVGEIAWRWSFVAAFCLLISIGLAEWLDSIVIFGPVPALGPKARLYLLAAILVGGFGLLSTLAAGFGRSATVLLLFRTAETKVHFGGQLWIALIRAAVVLAAVLSCVGAWIMASSATPHPVLLWPSGSAFCGIFMPLALLITAAFAFAQFILVIAALYAAIRADYPTAIYEAVAFLDRRTPEVAIVAFVFLLLRALVFAAMFSVALSALELAGHSLAAATALAVTSAIFYAAVSNVLLITRMAAYAALIEDDRFEPAVTSTPAPVLPPTLLFEESSSSAS